METKVQIPCELWATYEDGEIKRIEVSPLASAAYYGGPAAVVFDGDDELDVESTDGPFWVAMQQALLPCTWVRVMDLDQSDDESESSTILIEWTE